MKYYLKSGKIGAAKEEVVETLGIATLIGGTIVIPHLRRTYEYWELLEGSVPKISTKYPYQA